MSDNFPPIRRDAFEFCEACNRRTNHTVVEYVDESSRRCTHCNTVVRIFYENGVEVRREIVYGDRTKQAADRKRNLKNRYRNRDEDED